MLVTTAYKTLVPEFTAIGFSNAVIPHQRENMVGKIVLILLLTKILSHAVFVLFVSTKS
jgi:hypothetical protein